MTSKFRRNNTDKKLNLLQKEHDSILSELSNIEDGTDNNSIMDVINPAFKDLNMNNNNIYNTGDIQTVTINGGTFLSNPLSSTLDCSNYDIKNVNDIKCTTVNTQSINVDYIATNNTNNIDINAVLGSLELKSIITNSHSNIDMKNNEILNVSKITSNTAKVGIIDGINPNIGITKNLDMATRQILNCSRINRAGGSLIIDGQEVIIDNLSTIGNGLSPVTYTSDCDMNFYNLLNVGTLEVNEIKDHVVYKNLISGNEIKYNGRVNVKVITTTTSPTLLFRIQYTHNCSVYEGRFMSSNYTQGKIWTSPAICVVQDNVIDKNIGGSGIASIGGTTRASTIDFVINSGYLEGYVTANFTDETVSIFDFNVYSDLY
jgi:hypothetical protein